MAGLTACFSDPYTRETMGPDGANFSDLSTAVSLQVEEQPVRGAPEERVYSRPCGS